MTKLSTLFRCGVVATVSSLVLCGAGAAAADSTDLAQHSAGELRVVNYNTMLLSTWMTLDNSQFNNSARVQAMLDNGFLDDKDVIVLEELFHIDASKKLLNGLYDKGYRYQTRVVGASKWEGTRGRDWDGEHLNGGGLENGGVAIVSRHPIEVSEQQVFAKGCAADKHAQKGFAYARINKGGHLFHVAGTHPQATDSGCGSRKDAAEVRASQFKEIDQFFTRKERDNEIASTEPALIVGDLNVDRDTPEYVDMLRLLQASDGRRAGERHSFDTQNNELAKIRYPDDQPEDLDFALQRRGHPPVDDWSYEVTRPRSTSPLVVEGRTGPGGIFVKDQVRDLSDHYALTASGTMPARSAKSWRLRIDRITMTKGDEQNDSGDDLYGDVTVNGTYLWSVARGNSLNNKKFPYDLPSVSHQYLMSDEGFTIHVHIVDNDTIGDDELVDASERWNPVGNSPGTHTVTLTGRYGAADLTYTVEHT